MKENIQIKNNEQEEVIIKKGEEMVKIGEQKSFTLQLIGVYRFCLRAVVNVSSLITKFFVQYWVYKSGFKCERYLNG